MLQHNMATLLADTTRMLIFRLNALALLLALLCGGVAQANINVVTSIKPIHSLAASIMHGTNAPALIVDRAGSPHAYSLKPSQARDLQNANVVFWVGPSLETFLERPLASLATNARIINLIDAPGLHLLAFREDEMHAGQHGELHTDPHIWLDVVNAKAMARYISAELIKLDPTNAAIFEENTNALLPKLDQLQRELDSLLSAVQNTPFMVFHDSLQYFENRHKLSSAGSISINPEIKPGAERISHVVSAMRQSGTACVFAEPQFNTKILSVVAAGNDVTVGSLDPLGSTIENGPGLYEELMRDLAHSIKKCLL